MDYNNFYMKYFLIVVAVVLLSGCEGQKHELNMRSVTERWFKLGVGCGNNQTYEICMGVYYNVVDGE